MKELTSEETMHLAMTAIIILIAGMALWKIGGLIKKGRKEPKKSTFFKNNMKERQNKL